MNTKIIFAVLIAAGTLFAGLSCKKDSTPGYVAPSITRVAQPLNRDTSLTAGVFDQWLIIYGSHLGSTQQVSFNGEVVMRDQLYATDSLISVQIPRIIPVQVTNQIVVTTKGGTATYSFAVNVPPLKLDAILNEYTPVGDTLTLIGENFDLYKVTRDTGVVTFTGGVTAKILTASADTVQVIVPQGAQRGQIAISGDPSLGSLAKTQSSGWYMDNRNFLFDMSNFGGWNGKAFLSSGPDPAPINGPYFKVNKSWQGGWSWDPFCSDNCAIPAALVSDPGQYVNYALKFEMNVPDGPPSLPLKLYMCFNSGNFKDYFFDPGGRGIFPFTTHGKWQTFTVPLKNWGNLNGFNFSPSMIMEFMLKDANPSQSNFSICNFRLVPIN